MQQKINTRSGFTLIELSLSILFISVLSIIVVVMISNAVSAYHKGLTLNQVNTVGMAIVDDMRVAVQGSPGKSPKNECAETYMNKSGSNGDAGPVKKCETDEAEGFVYRQHQANITPSGTNDSFTAPIYGVFCTGRYSYLWNSGYLLNDGETEYDVVGIESPLKLKYRLSNGDNGDIIEMENIKLVKVRDDNRSVCKIASGYKVIKEGPNKGAEAEESEYIPVRDLNGESVIATVDNNVIDISDVIVTEEAVELLEGSDNLRIYGLASGVPAENGISNNAFYSVNFTLGTVQGGINVDAIGCEAPESGSSMENFDYCAINKFNFAAVANGEYNGK